MSLEDVGAALAAEREKKHLSIEDVAESLKISASQIRAIEAGDLDSLPHPAYAKGFIRSYANWLGISPEELKSMLEQPKGGQEEGNLERKANGGSAGASKAVLVLVALGLIAAGVWYAWQNEFFHLFNKTETGTSSESAELPTAGAYMAAKDKEREKAVNETPAENASQLEPKPEAQKEAEPAPVVSAPEQQAKEAEAKVETQIAAAQSRPAAQAEAPAAPERTDGQHKLIITAIEECWIHSNADKTDTRQFSLRKGDTFALTFSDVLELKLGNAGGVRLRYDGEDLPAPGSSGQVKSIVFPPKTDS